MKGLILVSVFLAFLCTSNLTAQKLSENYLCEMADVLNKSVPKFKEIYKEKGFYIDKGTPYNFFVYDLIDTTKNAYLSYKPVLVLSDGIYHFAPVRFRFSFSHIAVIKQGKMKIFRNLNCEGQGDDIEDVIVYIKDNFSYNEEILERVKNYRKYGIYARTDPQSTIQCN